MKLIRVDENGIQHQYLLPSLKKDIDGIDEKKSSSKQERIKKMLEASGKKIEEDLVFTNRIEPNFIYASISGYEYIKMNIVEFNWFIHILNALIEIDTDELGFYGVNLFVAKERESGNTHSYELVQFEFMGYSSNVLDLSEALRQELFDWNNPETFFNNIKYLG